MQGRHDQVRRKGGLVGAKKTKLNCGGSVLASEVHAGLFWGIGNPIGLGYAGIETQGGHDRVRREGELVWAKNKNKNIGTPTQCLQNIYD